MVINVIPVLCHQAWLAGKSTVNGGSVPTGKTSVNGGYFSKV